MEPNEHKLTAILVADVVGYSRLMGQDHEATVEALTQSRKIFSTQIENRKGRVVDAKGDSILAEFPSVVDAVACAVEIQRELSERNAQLPEERRMHFRIGVNLGDVIVKDGDLYGDGVNIAARLESLADPAEVYISGTAYDQLQNRLPLEYENLGEQSVKNIDHPIRVYRVLSKPGAAAHRVVKASRIAGRRGKLIGLAASAIVVALLVTVGIYFTRQEAEPDNLTDSKAGPVLPDKPSIAVLPFTNMSGDPEQEYFSDGITDTLITDLSKLQDLFVIARHSVFTYKGKAVDVRQVGRELGVRYVLEGGVQRSGDQIRINVQLINALTGAHLWAERYDREFDEIFALQDEITREVVSELGLRFGVNELGSLLRKSTDNPEAYDLFLRGFRRSQSFSKEDLAAARSLYERAIAKDPEFAQAINYLGWAHWVEGVSGWSDSPAESIQLAEKLARRATEIDGAVGSAYTLLGVIQRIFHRNDEEGLLLLQIGAETSPSDPVAVALWGWHVVSAGQPAVGLRAVQRAIRLDPKPLNWMWVALGDAYFWNGRYEEAIAVLNQELSSLSEFIWAHIILVYTYSQLDRLDDARRHAEEILRINPAFSLDSIPMAFPPDNMTRVQSLLRRAGLE